MTTESIAIPAERVPPVATDASSASKIVAGVLLFVTVVLGLGALGAQTPRPTPGYSEAYDAGYQAGALLGMLLVVAIPAFFGFRAVRNASRATRAAAVAKSDPSYAWRLAGKWIVAADGAGVPRPHLSFKISDKLRTMLLAVPRAEVREG